MPAKLKALVEKGKELEGWTSAADIVREMTLHRKEREGGRNGGEDDSGERRPNLLKTCQIQDALTLLRLHVHDIQLNGNKHALTWERPALF